MHHGKSREDNYSSAGGGICLGPPVAVQVHGAARGVWNSSP